LRDSRPPTRSDTGREELHRLGNALIRSAPQAVLTR
jgi:hypothetical protein